MFGECHKHPWKYKNQGSLSITLASDDSLGAGTSVDVLVSSQGGLVPKATGILTCSRTWGAILFVDCFSHLVYVYLTQDTSLESILASKTAYEAFAASHGVKVKRYHADNVRFADQEFKSAIESSN